MSIIKKVKSKYLAFSLPAIAFASCSAMAAEGTTGNTTLDLSTLTDSVNFSGVLTAIMAIAATLITLYAGYVGVRWVLRMVKGA